LIAHQPTVADAIYETLAARAREAPAARVDPCR